jgi:hypothetical protein
MFESLKKWFAKKAATNSADVDPLAVALLTTDTSADKPISDSVEPDNDSAADERYDADDIDIDV